MADVERALFLIFSFYSLHGNPLDPEHVTAQQFVKFAKECAIVGVPGDREKGRYPVKEAEVNVVYVSEVKRKGRVGSRQKMNFADFLTALMKLSIRVYKEDAKRSVDEAFQRLLMENVLPCAGRRDPEPVTAYLDDPDVAKLEDYYHDALEQIFFFYATGSDMKKQDEATLDASGSSSRLSTRSSRRLSSSASRGRMGGANSMKCAMAYPAFLKFASDFDLANSVILSTLELGDIYLSSLRQVEPDSPIRKLTFPEFWEALVRCALIAYSKISKATVIDKIRGLFLYMWRSINRSVPRTVAERRDVSTYAGDLISGAMLFNKRFTAQWAEDGYRDYLNPEAPREETGRTVLRRIMGASTAASLEAAISPTYEASAAPRAGGGGGAASSRSFEASYSSHPAPSAAEFRH